MSPKDGWKSFGIPFSLPRLAFEEVGLHNYIGGPVRSEDGEL